MKALVYNSRKKAENRDLVEAFERGCDMKTTTGWWGVEELDGMFYLKIPEEDIANLPKTAQADLVDFPEEPVGK